MTYKFGLRSLSNLQGVHPDLVRVMNEAIENAPYDFTITEGRRTPERQKELFEKKLTQTMNSRHLTGHAVDVAVLIDGKVSWEFSHYQKLAKHILAVAKLNDVAMRWGGDWDQDGDSQDENFIDGPHFELRRKEYP